MDTSAISIKPEELAIIGTIISSLLEVFKSVPVLLMRWTGKDFSQDLKKLLPLTAICLGMLIDYIFIVGDNYTLKQILFEGSVFGLGAIGGREVVMSAKK